VLVVLAIGLVIMYAIAIGVVALLGGMLGEPGRVGCGILSYVWVEAVLVQPAICVLRLVFGPDDPMIVIILLGVGLIAIIIAAGRVVKSGFQLGNTGVGVLVVVASGLIGFMLDRLL
jgi:hypothetical protein